MFAAQISSELASNLGYCTAGHAGPGAKAIARVFTLAALVGLGLWVAGCSQSRDNGFSRIPTPQPPAFVAGPLAVLLTNTSGFSAQVTAVGESMSEGDVPLRGQLVGSGPHLFFAPERNKGAEKKLRAGNFFFIWNVAEHKGYVLSEALQGYAPISSQIIATNLVQAEGQALVRMSDGSMRVVQVVKGKGGFPVRISTMTNAFPTTVEFSKVRMEPVSADLFALPDGFTQYPTAEALADELAARQRNYRRKPASDTEEFQNLNPAPGRKQ